MHAALFLCTRQYEFCIDEDVLAVAGIYIPLANNLSSRESGKTESLPQGIELEGRSWKKLIKFPCIKPRRDSVLRFNHLQHSLGVSSRSLSLWLNAFLAGVCICIKLRRQLHFIQFLIKPLMAAITAVLEIKADGAAASPLARQLILCNKYERFHYAASRQKVILLASFSSL